MDRDSDQTRQKIVAAVGQLLEEEGFGALGVNAIARRAGVDKVLIYRYFGGFDGLLAAFAEHHAEWLSPEGLTGPVDPERAEAPGVLAAILQGHLHALRGQPMVQEVMRWELNERNALTDALAREREKRGLQLLAAIPFDPQRWPGLDLAALAAILYAGITHLILRSRTTDHYAGIDISSEGGWERIAAAIEPLVHGAFERVEVASNLDQETEP